MSFKPPFSRTWPRHNKPEGVMMGDKEWEAWCDKQRALAFSTDVMDGPEAPPKPDRRPMPVNKEADE